MRYQNSPVARRAPSAMLASFAHVMSGTTADWLWDRAPVGASVREWQIERNRFAVKGGEPVGGEGARLSQRAVPVAPPAFARGRVRFSCRAPPTLQDVMALTCVECA